MRALLLPSIILLPAAALAAGPEDFAKTPLEFFGAWGVSILIMGWWNWSIQRALTFKDSVIAKKDEALAALGSEMHKAVVSLATNQATNAAATATALEKIADRQDELCKWRP